MQADTVLSSLEQGILICDKKSRIIYFNEAYGKYIGCSLEEARGKKLVEYRKSAKAPDVIKTGKPVEGIIRREGAQEYFTSIYPIMENGQIMGSVSLVTSIASHQLKVNQGQGTLKERVRHFERSEIEAELAYFGDDLEGKKKAAEHLGISLASLYSKLQQ